MLKSVIKTRLKKISEFLSMFGGSIDIRDQRTPENCLCIVANRVFHKFYGRGKKSMH